MMIWISHNILDSQQQSSVCRKTVYLAVHTPYVEGEEQRLRKEALDVTIIRAYLTQVSCILHNTKQPI